MATIKAGFLKASLVCALATPLMAQPDPNQTQCETEWTDCVGSTHTVKWVCESGQQCCVWTTQWDGPDDVRWTSDDCTLSIFTGCDLDPCFAIFWDEPA